MRTTCKRIFRRAEGFTLIELMIVVAIIGILAAIAVPNFINYRNKSRVSAAVATAESIRAALASFAADSVNNLFPAAMADYGALTVIANANGGTLKATEAAMGITLVRYTPLDTDGDGTNDSYSMVFLVTGVPNTMIGSMITVAPEGIERTYAPVP